MPRKNVKKPTVYFLRYFANGERTPVRSFSSSAFLNRTSNNEGETIDQRYLKFGIPKRYLK